MTYIITALDAEARPLIEHYKLKRSHTLPYPFYTNDHMLLIVTGQGRENGMMGTSALCGFRRPQPDDILLNIGICAAPKHYAIGQLILIHQIKDSKRSYYPDILYRHTFTEASLLCVNEAASKLHEYPVDMESGGVFIAASRFFKLHQIALIKIVSDHFDPSSVTKDGVVSLILQNSASIDSLIQALQSVQDSNVLLSPEEKAQFEMLKPLFTHSQANQLEEALYYFKLKNPKRSIPFPSYEIPNSKRERSQLHEHLICLLTH